MYRVYLEQLQKKAYDTTVLEKSMKLKILTYSPILGALTVASVSSVGASAQDRAGPPVARETEAETVLTRTHPELQPIGLAVGVFRLYPSVAAEIGNDDNVKTEESDEVSDTFVVVSPSLKMRSELGRHTLNANIMGAIPRYSREKTQNKNSFIADASLKLNFPRGWFVNLSGLTESAVEKPGLKLPANAQFPLTYDRQRAEVASGVAYNDIEVTASLVVQKFSYDDNVLVTGATYTPIELSQNDRSDDTLRLRVDYALSPSFSVYGAARSAHRRYDLATAKNRDSDVNALMIGAEYSRSNIIRVDLAVGSMDQKFLDPSISDLSGLSVISNIEWSPTRLTTFRMSFTRQEGDPFILEATSLLTAQSSLRVDHELLRNLIIMAEFQTVENEYQGISRKDSFKTVTAGGNYILNRRYALKLRYTHSQLKSLGLLRARDYQNSIVNFGIVVSY